MSTTGAPTALALPTDRTGHEWGGRLCLAVVNSVLWRRSDRPDDLLVDYPALVRHVARSGAIEDPAALLSAADADPAAAAAALAATVALREVLFDVFSAVAAGRAPGPAQLEALNAVLGLALAGLRLRAGSATLTADDADLDLPRRRIAVSAAAVLTTDEPARIKQCPGERCGWVFVDTSRNRSRRWCEPAECGNRERVRAHYRRSRSGG